MSRPLPSGMTNFIIVWMHNQIYPNIGNMLIEVASIFEAFWTTNLGGKS